MADGERHRWRRVAVLVIVGVAFEGALFGLARLSPAMAGLVRPMYAAVAAVLAYGLWNSARRRRGLDRRQTDRRRPPSSAS